MLLEVKPELLPEPELQQVVVQTLLRDVDFQGGVFQGVAQEVLVFVLDAVVELAPETHFLNYVLDGALFSAFLRV